MEGSLPGTLTVIIDSDASGSFIPMLKPATVNDTRIVMASAGTNESASFLAGGNISFSTFFWEQVLNGATVRDAWIHAKRTIKFAGNNQSPQLNDNGNRLPNEKADGRVARDCRIGIGTTVL